MQWHIDVYSKFSRASSWVSAVVVTSGDGRRGRRPRGRRHGGAHRHHGRVEVGTGLAVVGADGTWAHEWPRGRVNCGHGVAVLASRLAAGASVAVISCFKREVFQGWWLDTA